MWHTFRVWTELVPKLLYLVDVFKKLARLNSGVDLDFHISQVYFDIR